MNPLVSIVIVNYNARDYLKSCINSVLNCYYTNIEVIVVDNYSNDGSFEFLIEMSKLDSRIKVIRNEENLGLSVPRNQGAKAANGKYIAFIDNDTRVHPLWLNEAIKNFELDPKIGACQCKLILDNDTQCIDSVGEYLSQYGFLVHITIPGKEKDIGQYDYVKEIFAAKGAGTIIRKDILDFIGGFDDDYFFGLEETDVCWRIWLQNYKIVLIPKSVVYHKFGTSSIIFHEKINYIIKFHGTKNYIATLFKNLGLWSLIKILPIHIGLWMGIISYFLFKRQFESAKWIFYGMVWNLKNMRKLLDKRKIVQSQRKVKDREIFPKILKKTNLKYFIENFRDPRQVGHASRWTNYL